MAKLLTTEEFIKRAKKTHGDKYNYSRVEYVNGNSKICIICEKHGEFYQRATDHIQGGGCITCSCDRRLLTKEQFIHASKKIHGDIFDYSEVEYINSQTKVKIICPVHGIFLQKPNSHLSGNGCPKCSGRLPLTTDEFIKKAKMIHGDIFDYSEVQYINHATKVIITCATCNHRFLRKPNDHLAKQKYGCPKCAGYYKTNEDFIKQAQEIHGLKYNYDLIDYQRATTKIIIICPEHGEFIQRPSDHLSGYGCPICNESRGEKKISSYLKKHNIKFKQQQTFEDCKNILSLPFDFFLPDYNLLIEYDGIQHFEPREFFGGEEAFKSLIERDRIKTEYANEHGSLSLLRIAYTDFDNIETILEGLYSRLSHT